MIYKNWLDIPRTGSKVYNLCLNCLIYSYQCSIILFTGPDLIH